MTSKNIENSRHGKKNVIRRRFYQVYDSTQKMRLFRENMYTDETICIGERKKIKEDKR